MKRYGDWMQTYSGVKFFPLDPYPEEINIIDISHCLSRICRYAGHTKRFYSVAEHSLIMADIFPEFAGIALFHDAAEAYFSDLPRPIKNMIPEFKIYEHNLLSMIFQKYGIGTLNSHVLGIIEKMDLIMLALEKKSENVMQNRYLEWECIKNLDLSVEFDMIKIDCLSPEQAEKQYRSEIKKFLGRKNVLY